MKVVTIVVGIILIALGYQAAASRRLKAISQGDFDRLNLGLNFEWLELELFRRGYAQFPASDYVALGLPAELRELVAFSGDQEVGHVALLTEILGPKAAKSCQYNFPYTDLASFLDFSQVVTTVGESGYIGFTQYLQNRTNIQRSAQIFGTESKQNALFRGSRGLQPLSNSAGYFDSALTESQAYTLNAPYIGPCPPENPPIPYTKFPDLIVTSVDKTNKEIKVDFVKPASPPTLYAVWIYGLNITFVDFKDATTVPIPPTTGGTAFVAITSAKDAYTDYTDSSVDDKVIVAGPQGVVLG